MRARHAGHIGLALVATALVGACATPRGGRDGERPATDTLVATGYGTGHDRGRTSAVSRITSVDIERAGGTNLVALIESRLSGVRVIPVGGDFVVRIRGASSFQSNVNALVLIDGIEGKLGSVHVRDIASIEVLKDAAVTIYGARGANGVLLITTKKR
ncbi:MAG: TonB-dependent receptor plug domain-containing protein [Gemmatimonadaceae bacterium]|nr:TonB-dependent receptor plug domain-containing protein [Gemmatimonadaceae bacterium]